MCERCVHTFVTIRANRRDSKPSAVSLAWAHEPLKRLSEKSIGLSPLQFNKVRRLNAARHVLANADPEEASVKSVATSHGFFHLGRFARDYKSLFGESPSMTLADRHSSHQRGHRLCAPSAVSYGPDARQNWRDQLIVPSRLL